MVNLIFGILLIVLGVVSVLLKDHVARDRHPSIRFVLPVILIMVGLAQIYLQVREYCYTRRKEAVAAASGSLGRTYVLQPDKGIFPQLEIGSSMAMFRFVGIRADSVHVEALREVFGINGFTISVNNSIVMLCAKFRDSTGNIVAEIIDNEWMHKPLDSDLIWDRNYSRNAIEVKDGKGRVMLQVCVLDDRIQLQGIFYGEDGHGCALYESHAADRRGGLFQPHVTDDSFPVIEPIFKYPSNKYLGVYSDTYASRRDRK